MFLIKYTFIRYAVSSKFAYYNLTIFLITYFVRAKLKWRRLSYIRNNYNTRTRLSTPSSLYYIYII